MQVLRSRNLLIGFAMIFATLLANALLGYLNVRRLYTTERAVAHTHDLLLELNALLTTLVEAQTGQRGYVITGDATHLEPYRAAAATVDAELGKIDALVAHDGDQHQSAQKLREKVRWALDAMRDAIAARQQQTLEGPQALALMEEGGAAMDQVRKIIQQMQDQERARLANQLAASEVSYWTAMITGLMTAGLGLGLAAVAFMLVDRDLTRRAAVADELQASKERLEQRVWERTAAIRKANEALRAEIDERQQAEKQARRFADELQRSNRELDQFASIASHDLQEPLRKVQAFAERLRAHCRDKLDQAGQDYLDRMLAAVSRMQWLIHDLLEYARVSTHAQPLVPVDLEQLVQEVVGDLENRIGQTQGRISVGRLPTIVADPSQMRQLFQNLLSNALKFHRPGVPPEVEVSARLVGAVLRDGTDSQLGLQCELTVSDNGIGFEQADGERIFDLFQRLHGRQEYEGTGMGLAICKKIVERHGGRISATSSPGAGARFQVILPVQHPSAQEENFEMWSTQGGRV